MSATTSLSAAASSAQAAAIAAIKATMLSEPPPPGEFVNLIDPPSQKVPIIAVSVIFLVLTVAFVGLRLYANFFVKRSWGAEDYFCIIATSLSIAYVSFILDLAWVSRHMWDVPVIWFSETYWKKRYAQNNIVAFAFLFSRIPILLLYLRIFKSTKKFRYAVYFGFAADFAIYMVNVPVLAYFCAPRPGGSWDTPDTLAKCARIEPLAIVQGACNILLDIYILLLPVQPIVKLQMPTKSKLNVLAVFTTGIFALVASCVSLYYRYELTYGPDVNWNEGAFVASAVVEINVAIICSSMPACHSLVKHYCGEAGLFASIRSLFSGERSQTSSAGSYDLKGSQTKYNLFSPWRKGSNQSSESQTRLPDHEFQELSGGIGKGNDKNAVACFAGPVEAKRDYSGVEGNIKIKRSVDVEIV
ncbi:0de9d5bd-53e4-4820-bcb1-d4ed5f30df0c [Sclerotinia trifoliorum]|uniref:0de9d5bd-53e4-4820-bcb1-d4ed5f30df0c n=1 Tax=Sclerotinia trifoliorum TaxID=28548 RepID=A0A8H2ZM62_9HELO|nr:0de9d5bd-53e4-4820-bcb1-d4ed5f30df0c [Sclerotinia trifoliorum]